ncbi:SAM-dependent methyltransferase [Aliifodinibius salipaludis]|uniref:SAM-dependent methyltransferase n=1 Tax=Fodinibius salipaludis TaxID=2032627 RepID=A0A2A2GDX3_9BACT|nr:class I SAM-dependent methyltransferase [Aliifodinibius salipaludis]PAU95558.1 SAM-dependent methyltransferase [Aliifodinibius salipaludis]
MSKSEKRFSKQADLYAKFRPDYPDKMYEFIFKHLNQQRIAWDCATGSGQVAGYLSNHFDQVFANDISKEQLSYAPEKANITYLNTPAEHSGLPDDTFDLITIAQAIHWLNFDQFYNEVRRTAAQNGLLAVIGYGMVRISERVNPIIDEMYETAFSKYFNENRRYLDNRYQNIPFPFDEIPTPSFEKHYTWSLDQLEGYFNSWSAIQRIKAEEGYNPADETINELEKALSNPKKFEATFPIFMRLGKID